MRTTASFLSRLLLLACGVLTGLPSSGCLVASAFGRRPEGTFRDVTARAGLAFRYDNDATPAHRFIETTGGGCAFLDADNDGLLDVFAVQGGPAPGGTARARPADALCRNQGDGTFRDVTREAGLDGDTGYAQGVAAADYDNDGWTDLLVTRYGGLELFHNRHGRFERVTRAAGLVESGEAHWCTSAAWGDYDRDGFLDLFVCHYASWFPDVDHPCFDEQRQRIYCAPTEYLGDTSELFHNNRDGTFRDVSGRSGIGALSGRALGAAWLDADADGWPDLFVANDMSANWLLRNNHDGTFRDAAAAVGVANGPAGLPLSGMGVAAADFDGDGQEDLFVANFSRQPRSYFRRQGPSIFQWFSARAGVGDANQPFLAFGVESLDYDLDGWPDLVVGNGHVNERVEGDVTYRERQQLLRNRGDGRFEEDRAAAGDLDAPRVTRGLAVGDFDNDGHPDVLASGPAGGLALFRNDGFRDRHWIGFRLRGSTGNRDGVGARVTVTAGGRPRVRVARSGSSYASRGDPRCLFGLGALAGIDAVEVAWPDGRRTRHAGLAAGRYYLLDEEGGCAPEGERGKGPAAS